VNIAWLGYYDFIRKNAKHFMVRSPVLLSCRGARGGRKFDDRLACCNPEMIMFYFAKIEVSYSQLQ